METKNIWNQNKVSHPTHATINKKIRLKDLIFFKDNKFADVSRSFFPRIVDEDHWINEMKLVDLPSQRAAGMFSSRLHAKPSQYLFRRASVLNFDELSNIVRTCQDLLFRTLLRTDF